MKAIENFVNYFMFVFCIVVFVISLPGMMGVPIYAVALFFMVVPGYAFTGAFFPDIPNLERGLLIVGFGIAVPTFLEATLSVLLDMIGMVGTGMGDVGISTLLILDGLTMILISYVIMRDRGKVR